MKVGFDELYIVVKFGDTIETECLYDSQTADKKVDELKSRGYTTAYKASLETAFYNRFKL